MPYRNYHFGNGEIYHVFNRSVAREPIFKTNSDNSRALKLLDYYRYPNSGMRFSYYNQLEIEKKNQYLMARELSQKPIVDILAFCFMPNHFHFLLKQNEDSGISSFTRTFQNSYAKYFNTKYRRSGSLFQAMFKGVHMETDEQLLHVSRYIHLNPVTSSLIKLEDLKQYDATSFKNYLTNNASFLNSSLILSYFSTVEEYCKFVYDSAHYQRELQKIKHLIFDE